MLPSRFLHHIGYVKYSESNFIMSLIRFIENSYSSNFISIVYIRKKKHNSSFFFLVRLFDEIMSSYNNNISDHPICFGAYKKRSCTQSTKKNGK